MAETTLVVAPKGPETPVLVSIFLGGGADGLHLAAPLKDDYYRRNRPSLALSKDKGLPLDDIFSFHPEMTEAHKLYADGQLAVIHQCGTEENSRSHFEATDYLHYGGRSGGGWLGRFVRHTTGSGHSGALRAVSIGDKVSDELQGTAAVPLRSIADFKLPSTKAPIPDALAKLYAKANPGLASAASETLEAIERIRIVAGEHEAEQEGQKKKGKGSGKDRFTEGLELIAKLIKMNLGLRAATIELGGWDSHLAQGRFLATNIPALSRGLAAFSAAMGADLKLAHVVVMTEFGRCVSENASLGTDHGRGSIAMVLGGGVKGGKVHHAWQGLNDQTLEDPEGNLRHVTRSDLAVKIDFRQVLLPIAQKIAPQVDVAKLFPGFTGKPLELFA